MGKPPNHEHEHQPTIDDALRDPELIRLPRIKAGEYPHHAVLRPQWLKSHSRYPYWFHHQGDWLWMTKALEYAGDPILSPEWKHLDELDPSQRPAYTGTEQNEVELEKYEDDPTNFILENLPGEIEVTVDTVGEKTQLGSFPTVKAALAAFEEFWLANRARIWETSHHYPEVVIEAPDWRYSLRHSLERPPEPPIIEHIKTWLLNMEVLGRPIIRTRFGSFVIYQPEAISFYENPEYPGNQILRLSDKNGDHSLSIAIEAVTELDREGEPGAPADPENTFEAVADPSLPPMR